MDRQIGAVRVILWNTDRPGGLNTIVMFTSDTGGERLSNTWPFTGKKSEA